MPFPSGYGSYTNRSALLNDLLELYKKQNGESHLAQNSRQGTDNKYTFIRGLTMEQITKADRNACHALCGKGKARATLRRLSSTVRLTVSKY